VSRLRSYVWTDDGPLRLPQRFFRDSEAHPGFPQFAGTEQRVVNAFYDLFVDGVEARFEGSTLPFDTQGQWDRSRSTDAAVEKWNAADQAARIKRAKIVDLSGLRIREAIRRKGRWTLSQDDMDRILFDLLPRDDPRHCAIPIAKGAQVKARAR
jgi:hypothetical protein